MKFFSFTTAILLAPHLIIATPVPQAAALAPLTGILGQLTAGQGALLKPLLDLAAPLLGLLSGPDVQKTIGGLDSATAQLKAANGQLSGLTGLIPIAGGIPGLADIEKLFGTITGNLMSITGLVQGLAGALPLPIKTVDVPNKILGLKAEVEAMGSKLATLLPQSVAITNTTSLISSSLAGIAENIKIA